MTLTRYDAADVAFNPDAQIARNGSSPKGDDIYNFDGHDQRLTGRLAPGSAQLFEVTLANDGVAADKLRIAGCHGSSRFRVSYRLDGENVTEDVQSGELESETLASGESLLLRVRDLNTDGAPAATELSSLA